MTDHDNPISALVEANRAAVKAIENLTQLLSDKDADCSDLQGEISKLKGQLEAMKQPTSVAAAGAPTQHDQIVETQQAISARSSDAGTVDAKAANEQLKKELADLKVELKKFQKREDELYNILDEAYMSNDRLEEKLALSDKCITELRELGSRFQQILQGCSPSHGAEAAQQSATVSPNTPVRVNKMTGAAPAEGVGDARKRPRQQ
ncbi:hypothetical protein BDZ90DRAFT_269030 [Jaminaea rosea]|uniref:Uncharacterized protein n=1 Tax=Jaminaea rosea TaxID=1569628 RepID=A0A316UH29_9BASI|nr:hypothetical protein BDZ90DRAFT_269030 [Jaminaea rosea]PWN24566.1 hypothetical protein BDZ90DRAFT_269030 [Jaminaea rosea]